MMGIDKRDAGVAFVARPLPAQMQTLPSDNDPAVEWRERPRRGRVVSGGDRKWRVENPPYTVRGQRATG